MSSDFLEARFPVLIQKDNFRIARHPTGIAPIDHTSAFDGKSAGHSGATDFNMSP